MEKELKEREIITEEDIDKNNPAYNENNENREFYVYEHIRLDNMTCFYVGKGKGKRAYDLERNDHHNNISNRYGHAVVIIKDNLTEEEAFKLERDTIEDYVFNIGYGINIEGYKDYSNNEYLTNCTWGGEGTSGIQYSEERNKKISESLKGKKLSEERKKNISKSLKGIQFSEERNKKISESMKGKNKGKHHSEETKLKISEANKGENNSFYGKHHSEETKQKISEANKGRIPWNKGKYHSEEAKKKMSESRKGKQLSEEHKKNISESCKGRQLSEETKLKISESKKGKNHPLYGKHLTGETKEKISEKLKGKKHSEEAKRKMSEAKSKKVICINTGEKFNSVKEAGNHYDIAQSNIAACCRGKRNYAGKLQDGIKLQWKYLENYDNDFKGRHHSEETKKKISESCKGKASKKVICITTGKIFNSLKDASNYYNVVLSSISKCCRGTRKSTGKLPYSSSTPLQWKFLENYNNEFKGILINPITD